MAADSIINTTLRRWAARETLMNQLAFSSGGHSNHGGRPWKRRTKSYPWPIMHRTGKLKRGVKWIPGDKEGDLVNKVPYAKYHQAGSRRLPQRKVVTITQPDIERLKQNLKKDLERELNNGR